MQVTVEGVVTSIEQATKDEKKFTVLMLAQKGEQQQVKVRLAGHCAANYSEFQVATITGRLMTWKTRDGVGMMVMADDDDSN